MVAVQIFSSQQLEKQFLEQGASEAILCDKHKNVFVNTVIENASTMRKKKAGEATKNDL